MAACTCLFAGPRPYSQAVVQAMEWVSFMA